ncbi:hypothetical protein WIS52_11780 [Pseudonocardia nematodicida]|uniref:Uncharacterized protein n=1 Tax=Pseudonocardia nematodicida TaxID=1206997 RepID=A0ABV1KAH0_9PSEU
MSTPAGTDARKDDPKKVSMASMIGTAVESYDFFIYGTAAAAYFGAVFFQAENPIVGVLGLSPLPAPAGPGPPGR